MKNADITFDEFKLVLQENSQRITLPRLGVLKILKSNHNPLTMSEIHDLINKEITKSKRILFYFEVVIMRSLHK